MKKYGLLALGAALALPLVAHGKLAIPSETLGKVEANLDVCSQADSKSAEKFQGAKKILTQGATEQEIDDARGSDEYKHAYSLARKELEKKPKAELAKTCAAALEGKN
jgi:hypothetical protein